MTFFSFVSAPRDNRGAPYQVARRSVGRDADEEAGDETEAL